MHEFFTAERIEKIKDVKSKLEQLMDMSEIWDCYKTNPTLCISGGCIPSLFHDQPINDFDIFLMEKDMRELKTLWNFFEKTKGFWWHGNSYSPVTSGYFMKPNSRYQYIWPTTIIKTPEDVVENFDLEHLKSYYYMGKLYISPLTYECIEQKLLMQTSKYLKPARYAKYLDRGYTFP